MNHFYSPIDKALYNMMVISKKELMEKGGLNVGEAQPDSEFIKAEYDRPELTEETEEEKRKTIHRYKIEGEPEKSDFIHHTLDLKREGDNVFLFCQSHNETVVMFYPGHAEFVHDSCMRHGAVEIPFEIHHYRNVEDANKKE